jgi:hypothetical protein
MTPAQRLPFVLASAVPSLSIVVVITEIGTAAKKMNSDIAAALVGAALLSIMVYPTIAGFVLQQGRGPEPASGTEGSITPG